MRQLLARLRNPSILCKTCQTNMIRSVNIYPIDDVCVYSAEIFDVCLPYVHGTLRTRFQDEGWEPMSRLKVSRMSCRWIWCVQAYSSRSGWLVWVLKGNVSPWWPFGERWRPLKRMGRACDSWERVFHFIHPYPEILDDAQAFLSPTS